LPKAYRSWRTDYTPLDSSFTFPEETIKRPANDSTAYIFRRVVRTEDDAGVAIVTTAVALGEG